MTQRQPQGTQMLERRQCLSTATTAPPSIQPCYRWGKYFRCVVVQTSTQIRCITAFSLCLLFGTHDLGYFNTLLPVGAMKGINQVPAPKSLAFTALPLEMRVEDNDLEPLRAQGFFPHLRRMFPIGISGFTRGKSH